MFAASKSARSAAAGDNKFNYVTLLLNGDGTNGKQNNTFLDGSTNNFTITRNGTPTQGSFSPYGDLWSNYFNGSSYLNIADNAALQVAAGDFTIEAWVYPTSLPSAGNYKTLWSKRTSSGGTGGALLVMDSTGALLFFVASNSTTWGISGTSSGHTISLNTWQHLAVVRSGNNLILYKNGVAGSTISLTFSVYDTGALTLMAGTSVGDQAVDGYMSNFRLVKGTAVYTGAFTPSTTPLTAITNTSLLTCQSNRFRDASSNNFTITVNGTPSVQRFSPFEPSTSYTPAVNGGSSYFNGSSDYLSVPSGTFGFTSGTAFTVEVWIYPTSYPSSYPQLLGSNVSSTDQQFSLGISNTGGMFYGKSNVANVVSSASNVLALNQWNHIAVGRNSSGSARVWVNGVSVGTGTDSYTYNDSAQRICASFTGAYFAGYVGDLRSVKGTDVYGVGNSTITPPSAPLTAITNTSLLLNYTNAGISDAAAANDVITVGDAQVSTAVVKYGTASMKFDGTGDYLTIPNSQLFNLSSGDFTIEFWYYPASTSNQTLFSFGGNTTGYATLRLDYEGSTGKIYMLVSTSGSTWAVNVGSSVTIPTGTWAHVAAVRSGSTFTIYINGVSAGTATSSSTLYASTVNLIGVAYNSGTLFQYLNGYIDDLRVTKGYARYTANFTPPTAALPTF